MLELITLPYARPRWSGLLRQLFEDYQESAVPLDIPVPSGGLAESVRQLGVVTILGNEEGETLSLAVIEIIATEMVDLLRNRVGIRNLAARLIAPGTADGLLVATTQPGCEAWRFTFVHRETRFDGEGALVRHETPARRFTYVLGPEESCRTPDSRFQLLARHRGATTLAHVLDAFSVEKLSDEFFTTYKRHYADFCQHLIAHTDAAHLLGIDLTGLDGKERDRALKPVRDFVKKLLGRLVFLHFIQKKGWLGCPPLERENAALPQESMLWAEGRADFLREMFQDAPPADQERFHSTRLVPLFFATLNRPDREGLLFPVTGNRVPYLNGGLFEPDFHGVELVDFPAPLFAALLGFFTQYHFTIDENDPEEHEIGIDPEMLGRIFENLLEDNKDKGAYYTPKPVVQYMCQQSLIHALTGRYAGDADAPAEIERLVRLKEPVNAMQNSWLARHATELSAHLDDLRICDPAIGSGAFPIGLLQEIYWTKLTLNPSLDRAHAKRGIIQHCIHGVDLDAGAVEIARLRFWLALIVEENVPTPLPNLDYQIMQGNSLLESFEGERLDQLAEPIRGAGRQRLGSDVMELDLGGSAAPGELTVAIFTPAQHNFAELREEYYACHDPTEKAALRARIDAAALEAIDARLTLRREELVTSLRVIDSLAERTHRKGGDKRRAVMQAELDALAGKSARLHTLLENPRSERPFFLWHLWFRQILADAPEGRGGFDIVIANPPYLKERDNKYVFNQITTSQWGREYHEGKMDYWFYFLHQSLEKTRRNGIIAFITSRYWLRSSGARKLIRRIREDGSLFHIVDFGDLPVFEKVSGHHMLHFYHRSDTSKPCNVTHIRRQVEDLGHILDEQLVSISTRDQVDLFTAQGEICLYPVSITAVTSATVAEHFTVTQGVVQNPDKVSTVAANRYGLQKGLGVFVLDQAELLALGLSESESQYVKPFYDESAVQEYALNRDQRKFLLYLTKRNCESLRALPGLQRHLSRFRPIMEARRETQNGTIEWFHLHWPRNPTYFEDPRVILPSMFLKAHAVYLEEAAYFGMGSNIVSGGSGEYSLKVLCALFNSSYGRFWFFNHGKKRGIGVDVGVERLRGFPLPGQSDDGRIERLVDDILAAARAGEEVRVKELEAQIDTHVFRLYDLTPEQIALVRGASA